MNYKHLQQADMLQRMDQNEMIQLLYESLDYKWDTDKRSCFEHLQDLIDQIYGVDN